MLNSSVLSIAGVKFEEICSDTETDGLTASATGVFGIAGVAMKDKQHQTHLRWDFRFYQWNYEMIELDELEVMAWTNTNGSDYPVTEEYKSEQFS